MALTNLVRQVQSLRENYEALRGVDDASRVAAAEHSNYPFFIARRVFEEEGGKPSIQVAPLHTYEQFWRDTPHIHVRPIELSFLYIWISSMTQHTD